MGGWKDLSCQGPKAKGGDVSQLLMVHSAISYHILSKRRQDKTSKSVWRFCWYMTFVIYLSLPRLSFNVHHHHHWYMTFVIYLSFPLRPFFFCFFSFHFVWRKVALGLMANNFWSVYQIPMMLYIYMESLGHSAFNHIQILKYWRKFH